MCRRIVGFACIVFGLFLWRILAPGALFLARPPVVHELSCFPEEVPDIPVNALIHLDGCIWRYGKDVGAFTLDVKKDTDIFLPFDQINKIDRDTLRGQNVSVLGTMYVKDSSFYLSEWSWKVQSSWGGGPIERYWTETRETLFAMMKGSVSAEDMIGHAAGHAIRFYVGICGLPILPCGILCLFRPTSFCEGFAMSALGLCVCAVSASFLASLPSCLVGLACMIILFACLKIRRRTMRQKPLPEPPGGEPLLPTDDEVLLCRICMSRPKNLAYVPCGHVTCEACAISLMTKRFPHCPFCSAPIKSWQRIFL